MQETVSSMPSGPRPSGQLPLLSRFSTMSCMWGWILGPSGFGIRAEGFVSLRGLDQLHLKDGEPPPALLRTAAAVRPTEDSKPERGQAAHELQGRVTLVLVISGS